MVRRRYCCFERRSLTPLQHLARTPMAASRRDHPKCDPDQRQRHVNHDELALELCCGDVDASHAR